MLGKAKKVQPPLNSVELFLARASLLKIKKFRLLLFDLLKIFNILLLTKLLNYFTNLY